jgi:phage gpG-like protein
MEPRRAAMISATIFDQNARIRALSIIMPQAVQRGLDAGVLAAAIDVQGAVKNLLDGPVLNRRTRRLWQSITADSMTRGDRVVGVVGTNVVYAAIHEFGGTIRPKRAGGFLVWKGADGESIFAREVKMPRRPYMSRAFAERKTAVQKILFRAVMNAVRGRDGGKILPAAERKGVGFNAD